MYNEEKTILPILDLVRKASLPDDINKEIIIVDDGSKDNSVKVLREYLQDVEEGAMRWNVLMAGTLLAVVPVLAGYVFAQRYFVAGLTRGGLKG